MNRIEFGSAEACNIARRDRKMALALAPSPLAPPDEADTLDITVDQVTYTYDKKNQRVTRLRYRFNEPDLNDPDPDPVEVR